jgi:chromate transporter
VLKIGCIGFGGGTALIPLFEKEFIGEGKLDTKENFDQDILTASLTPGALPVELASSIGWRNFGTKGMFLAAVGMSLPGVLASLLLLTCLSGLREKIGGVMEVLTVLVSIYIIYLILKYIRKVIITCKHQSTTFFRRACLVMVGVFGLTFYCSTLSILLTAFAVIIVVNCIRGDSRNYRLVFQSGDRPMVLVNWLKLLVLGILPALVAHIDWSELILFFFRCCLSVLMSFGGGDAYLAVADGLFIDTGILSSSSFYGDIVPVANLLPGSILCKALTCIGFSYGLSMAGTGSAALALALIGYLSSIAVSCMIFHIVNYLYGHLSNFRTVQTISHYIGPIICGLLGSVVRSLIRVCLASL